MDNSTLNRDTSQILAERLAEIRRDIDRRPTEERRIEALRAVIAIQQQATGVAEQIGRKVNLASREAMRRALDLDR